MNNYTIKTINGIIMVSSKDVAKVVGIQNSHIVEHIDQWMKDNEFIWRKDELKELFVLASPEHPINGRKCRAYWISRNGIKHLKAQNDKYFKAKDLYFELLNVELGKTSDDTFESGHIAKLERPPAPHTSQFIDNMTTLEHRPLPPALQGNFTEGTLAIISDVERESLVGRPIEDDLRNKNGQIVVSSRMVAERFGKQHKHVLDSIEELIKGVAEKSADLFIYTQYQHPQNKQWYPEYLLTRDGFTLLAMGFTGREALQFKLAYIEAFNKMEEVLKSQTFALPQNYEQAVESLLGQIRETKKLQLEVQAKEEVIQVMTPKVEYHNAVLNRDDLITTTDIAKDLGMSATKLNTILVENKVLYRKNPKDSFKPYANYQWLITDGYADYKVYPKEGCRQNLQWTEKGRHFIIELLKGLDTKAKN